MTPDHIEAAFWAALAVICTAVALFMFLRGLGAI